MVEINNFTHLLLDSVSSYEISANVFYIFNKLIQQRKNGEKLRIEYEKFILKEINKEEQKNKKKYSKQVRDQPQVKPEEPPEKKIKKLTAPPINTLNFQFMNNK